MKAPVIKKVSKPDFAKYLKSLGHWWRQQPTANESDAVKIFSGLRHRIGKKMIEDILDGSSNAMTDSEKKMILFKIQQAIADLPEPNWIRLCQTLFIPFLFFQVSFLSVNFLFSLQDFIVYIFLFAQFWMGIILLWEYTFAVEIVFFFT